MEETNPWKSPSRQDLDPKSEINLEWKGCAIKISVEFLPSYFPRREQFSVFVDGSAIVCEQIPWSKAHKFSFVHEGVTVHGLIEGAGSDFRTRGFLIQIEGDWSHGHKVVAKRWLAACFVAALPLLLILGLVGLIVGFAIVIGD